MKLEMNLQIDSEEKKQSNLINNILGFANSKNPLLFSFAITPTKASFT
jgi:hypothetical protein